MRAAARSGAIRAGCAPDPVTYRPRRCWARLRCPTRITDSSGGAAGGAAKLTGDTLPPTVVSGATCAGCGSTMASPPNCEYKQIDMHGDVGCRAHRRGVGGGGLPGDALPRDRSGDADDVLQPTE